MPRRAKKFTVSDGELVLELQPADGGWYAVTCPFDPSLNTQGRSIEEAFEMARDAMATLRQMRRKHHKAIQSALAAAV